MIFTKGERDMASPINPHFLNCLIEKGAGNLALIDVREKSIFEHAHIFGSTQIPRRQLEFNFHNLVPIKNTAIVCCDGNGTLSPLAAATLEKLGYTDVYYLDGGVDAWKREGYSTVEGVNVPSKLFGEEIIAMHPIPKIQPLELKELMEKNEDFCTIEVRPPDEVKRSGSIPGAVNIPGVDLLLSIYDYANTYSKIILTCAGRTRSIVATRAVQLMGIKEVFDLENGTMGWKLAGLQLDIEAKQSMPPSVKSRIYAKNFAKLLIKYGLVQLLSIEDLNVLKNKSDEETVYFFDVRSKEEYQGDHLPGFSWVPGGQAVQCTDDYIALRNAKIILACDDTVRSVMTAYWLGEMGYKNALVLEGGIDACVYKKIGLEEGMPRKLPPIFQDLLTEVNFITCKSLKGKIDQGLNLKIIYVGESSDFTQGHIAGSKWISRGKLEKEIADLCPNKKEELIVTCNDQTHSVLAVSTLTALGYEKAHVLKGGMKAWVNCNLEIQKGLSGISGIPEDVYLKPYERGDNIHMKRYLDWEKDLVMFKKN